MLASGAITQEEFEQSKGFYQPEDNKEEQATERTNQDGQAERIEKLVQSAVDRATNRLGNENRKLREQLDKLKKEKLSEDELKKLEVQEKETKIPNLC